MLTQIKLNHSCLLIFFLHLSRIRCFTIRADSNLDASLSNQTLKSSRGRWSHLTWTTPDSDPTGKNHAPLNMASPKHYDELDRQMTSICPSLMALTRLSWLKVPSIYRLIFLLPWALLTVRPRFLLYQSFKVVGSCRPRSG
jgi:hypothetical protein